MRFKYCVALLLCLAVMGVVVLATPATAAKTGDVTTVAGPGGYYLKIVKSTSVIPSGIASPMSVSVIHQSEYQYQSKYVNYFTTQLPFDLYWGNPSNSLRLRIATPDGYVLGPYYDISDGIINGEINIFICRDSGVAQGSWGEEIYGYSVSGAQGYRI
jgi:hypothetical protein